MTTKSYVSSRLKQQFNAEIRSQLVEELKLKNVNEVPKISKVMVSVGLGRGKDDKKLFENATNTLKKITGQHPVQTIARKSIASFKLREGQPVGLKVTLRGNIMYEFIDRLINIVLPRVRDFHGVSPKSFDKSANYSIGLIDQTVFPELAFDEVAIPHGIQITIVTNTDNVDHSRVMLEKFGMPFRREEKENG